MGAGRHLEHWKDKLDQNLTPPSAFRKARSRIMYIECKGDDGIEGPARIGRVCCSKSGKSLYYGGRIFQSLKGVGFKANYYDVESGEHDWISGPRKDQHDRLYGGNVGVEVDADVRSEYLQLIGHSSDPAASR